MNLQHHIQLQSLNTMATPAFAKWFFVLQEENEISEIIEFCEIAI